MCFMHPFLFFFLFTGTFVPCKEVEVIEVVSAVIIYPNQALKLRARLATKDRNGTHRVTGEEWIVKKTGAYLPGAYEEVVDVVQAIILTEKVCCFFLFHQRLKVMCDLDEMKYCILIQTTLLC